MIVKKKKNKPFLANIGHFWPYVLVPFTSNYLRTCTPREVSDQTEIPRRTVSRILKELSRIKVLSCAAEGRNKRYCLSKESAEARQFIAIAEHIKAIEFMARQKENYYLVEGLGKDIVIFGSSAKGTAKHDSDLDVLILGDKTRTTSNKIHAHFITPDRFSSLLGKGDALAREIIENHIIIKGSVFLDICWRYWHDKY